MSTVVLAANNGDIGGGEVMLLACAAALRELGVEVEVVGPQVDGGVLDRAADDGFPVHRLDADRRRYMARLRRWSTGRNDWLWCHGLVPSVATTGRRRRIVHLHQDPRGRLQRIAATLARRGAMATVVPSRNAASRLRASVPLANWTRELDRVDPVHRDRPRAIGYLGRLSTDKGVHVLARAMASLPHDVTLLLAGDTRYVDPASAATVDRAVSALGDRAVRLGHVAPDELFRRVGLVVFPSVWSEPFGLVVAEAMAAGVPFVISDAGALPEVAGPDHPWVARAGDADDLARVVAQALAAEVTQTDDVTDRARQRWVEEYSPAAGRERVRRLLEDLEVL